jgi:hypothetical protein
MWCCSTFFGQNFTDESRILSLETLFSGRNELRFQGHFFLSGQK